MSLHSMLRAVASSAALVAASLALPAVSQAVVYQEAGGRVVGEAEVFSNRVGSGTPANWLVVPSEDAGTGTLLNARGGAYVQALPDGGPGGSPNAAPYIEYKMKIDTVGEYRLYVRWDGHNPDSDSIFFSINELSVGAASPGHYQDSHDATGNFNTIPWDGLGGANQHQGAASQNPMLWTVTDPGTYTLRISQREDGAAVDSFIFQRSNLDAPVANNIAPSLFADQVHTASLTPNADAHIQLGSAAANTNFGATGDILVKNAGATGSTTRKGYVRFDISGIDKSLLANAVLDLQVILNNAGGTGPNAADPVAQSIRVFGLIDGHAGESWVEGNGGTDNNPLGEITFNNAPGNIAGNDYDAAAVVLLGIIEIPAENSGTTGGEPIIVSLHNLLSATPNALLDFLLADTDGQVTFLFNRVNQDGSANLGFASKDHSTAMAPTLRLYSHVVPEPASAMLGLIGLTALALRRRKVA